MSDGWSYDVVGDLRVRTRRVAMPPKAVTLEELLQTVPMTKRAEAIRWVEVVEVLIWCGVCGAWVVVGFEMSGSAGSI